MLKNSYNEENAIKYLANYQGVELEFRPIQSPTIYDMIGITAYHKLRSIIKQPRVKVTFIPSEILIENDTCIKIIHSMSDTRYFLYNAFCIYFNPVGVHVTHPTVLFDDSIVISYRKDFTEEIISIYNLWSVNR